MIAGLRFSEFEVVLSIVNSRIASVFPRLIGLVRERSGTERTALGIACALVSTGLFVLVSVLVRTLSEDFSAMQILSFRQMVFVTLLIPAMYRHRTSLINPTQMWVHLTRIGGAFVALYGGFVSVSNLPLADATALGFLQVLFVAVISRIVLKETVDITRVVTIVLGFCGVLLVVRPTFSGEQLYVICGVVAAVGAAVAVICVRALSASEKRTNILAYQAVAVGAISLFLSSNQWYWPNSEQFFLLVLVGVISSIAQYFGVTAYKYAQANVVANVEYIKIIYSIALGYWLFSESPDHLTVIGAALILSSALVPFAKTRLLGK